jgi:Uma2 family endonuclease
VDQLLVEKRAQSRRWQIGKSSERRFCARGKVHKETHNKSIQNRERPDHGLRKIKWPGSYGSRFCIDSYFCYQHAPRAPREISFCTAFSLLRCRREAAIMSTKIRATIEDLYNIPENGKAEIINGEIVRFMPTGGKPGRAAGNIFFSLRSHEQTGLDGCALGDNIGFIVDLPNRDSFSPDAAWYTGEFEGLKFLQGAPRFAVEVRSENDYGRQAEREMAEKRRDYFAAGTLVVWDVDLLSDEVIKVYRSTDPENPTIYRRGEVAEADPAVPGWTMPVEELFK